MGSVLSCLIVPTMDMLLLLWVLLDFYRAVSCFTGCGHTAVSPLDRPFIVGGSEAAPHSIPWQISLGVQLFSVDLGPQCGGSIISSQHAITAAHCVTSFKHKYYYIIAGAHSLEKKDPFEKRVKVEKVTIHPGYNDGDIAYNDIALLKLSEPLEFNEAIQPICLPHAAQEWGEGDEFLVSGWGSLIGSDYDRNGLPLDGDTVYPDTLQQVMVPYYDHDKCSHLRYYRKSIHDKVICAGYEEGGHDACGGDSGGPLATRVNGKWTLAGVVSWAVGCAGESKPGIYTNVAKYHQWIIESM